MSVVVIGLLALLVLGTPIAVACALIVFLNADRLRVWPDSLVGIPYDSVSSFALIAIPLFMLVGDLMNRGQLTNAIARSADRLLGRVRAAFGYIMIVASAIMGAITGSSVATVAAIGSTLGGEMRRRGYPGGYVASLNAASGLLGVLIPPSIPLIVYGATVGVSISDLFLATIVPGLLMTLAFAATHFALSARILPGGREAAAPDAAVAPAAQHGAAPVLALRSGRTQAVTALLMPVIVLGGIYGGIFTPTEAAAVACLYAVGAVLLLRTMTLRDIYGALGVVAVPAAAIMLIIAMTGILNRALVLNQVPQDMAAFMVGVFDSPVLFLLSVCALLFVVGMFMETNAAVLLMGPLLAPAAMEFGIDRVHFAIIVVTNIEIGLITPPLAANLFVAARTNNVQLFEMLRYFGWFLAAAIAVVMVLVFVPALSLWYQAFL
ncbi:TRAP transporter large permease [Meridianimarinicoccus sp. RP-17]|uniref:TRAP transporter large permease n=1 Tax=Meridianimarinicoccus zhengii TaxID=2056810 RepID=UPI000DABB9CA|nr:TRAP transporter large permease [Phycocomes zhengii]